MTLLRTLGAPPPASSNDPWDGDPLPTVAPSRVLYERGALGLSLLVCSAALALRSAQPASAVVALLCYLVVAYTVRVVPHTDVWPEGPFGDAIRQLQDVNRQRAVLRYFFGVGRFVVTSMRDAASCAFGQRVIVLRGRDR